jgi:16S rRNA C967 or C1407 C5-methylase (RsmB/RsmF family)
MLQDFSSCLPVELLKNALKLDKEFKRYKNTRNKVVGVDSTAAPGNKTLQLMEICDKVYALERDSKRHKVL